MKKQIESFTHITPIKPIRKPFANSTVKPATFKKKAEEDINFYKPMSIDECLKIMNDTNLT